MTKKPKKPSKQESPRDYETPGSRDAVVSDFRKVAGPLRGRNRVQKPKS